MYRNHPPLTPPNLTLPLTSAYLLVAHGSRDPRPQVALQQLAQFVCEQLQHRQLAQEMSLPSPQRPPFTHWNAETVTAVLDRRGTEMNTPLVGTATLECSPIPLHQQIQQFASSALALGIHQIKILPLFLSPGVHVKEDLPAEVEIAQRAFNDRCRLQVQAHLGAHPGLLHLLATGMVAQSADAWILLAHGSRRVGANQPVEDLASHLGAVAAYWSVAPDLASHLERLQNLGYRRIAVVPYFLFAGTLTDAIAQRVDHLAHQFPRLDLQLAVPLEANSELASLICEMLV